MYFFPPNIPNKIFHQKGSGFFGKSGKFIGKKNLALFNDKTLDRRLIIVKREDQKYFFYEALVTSAQTKKPDINFIPEYYRNYKFISCWIKLAGELRPINTAEINLWKIQSSGMPVIKSLSSSMAGFFVARREKCNFGVRF